MLERSEDRSCTRCDRVYTNIAIDPVVSGENRRFAIFYCVHELVECGIEGRILLWPVDSDAALKHYVSSQKQYPI